MRLWTILELALAAIGVLLILVGQKFSQDVLTYAGFALMGATAIVIGLEAIVRRRIVLPSRYYRYGDDTYVGPAAIAQGGLFIFMGLFFIGVSLAAYLNSGRSVFLHFVRHPGLLLILFGAACLMGAIVAVAGSVEQKQGSRWAVLLDLFTTRLLMGLILLGLGVGAIGLGLFEMASPQAFDQMGGGFLEVLFGG